MWDPGFCQPSTCFNHTSSGSHSENGVPRSSMNAPQGSYFPADSPSSGVTVTGPPGHHMPTNLLLPRGRTSPQVPLPCIWRWGHLALPRKGSQWWPGLMWPALVFQGYLSCPPGKGPEASRLSTEPPGTSEKHLPLLFPEAEALVS